MQRFNLTSHILYLNRYLNAFLCTNPTVMFMWTLWLEWSKRTVTERIPSSTTTTERGKRKKATSAEASRQSTTDRTTYSFLQPRKYSFYVYILKKKITTGYCICCNCLLTFFGAAAFGHCTGSMRPVHSLDLSGKR